MALELPSSPSPKRLSHSSMNFCRRKLLPAPALNGRCPAHSYRIPICLVFSIVKHCGWEIRNLGGWCIVLDIYFLNEGTGEGDAERRDQRGRGRIMAP